MSTSREEKIQTGLSRSMKVLEIGPSYNPIVPKRGGWNAVTLDHADRAALVEKYTGHAGVDVTRIEDVDVIWRGESLDALFPVAQHGTFDACVASHVIEHIPDFLGFLVAVAKLLKSGGVLSLAVPDKRFCFDYFRPHSTTGQVLEVHRFGGRHHRPAAHFDHVAYACRSDGAIAWGQAPVGNISMITSNIDAAWKLFSSQPSEHYVDCHGWQFTPASFELIIIELRVLGLIDFEILRSFPSEGCEFIIQLQKVDHAFMHIGTANEQRLELLKRLVCELGEQARYFAQIPHENVAHSENMAHSKNEEQTTVELPPAESDARAEVVDAGRPEAARASQSGLTPNLKGTVFGLAKRAALLVPPIRRLAEQRDRFAALLAQREAVARVERNIAPAAERVPNPSDQSHSSGGGRILDVYCSEAPSHSNAIGIFAGEWSSAVPGFITGTVPLFDDARIKWLESKLGGFEGKNVLEIGPLEGGHTYMMEQRGARVTAIESNQRAFLKCLVVKEALGMRSKFLLGDVRPYLVTCEESYDFVLASGVLYHMTEPAELLKDLTRVTNRIGLWTHYYDEGIIGARQDLGIKFDREPTIREIDGVSVALHRRHYSSELAWAGFCGGTRETSCWFTKDSLFRYLDALNFDAVVGDENRHHPNGPCILLLLERRSSVA